MAYCKAHKCKYPDSQSCVDCMAEREWKDYCKEDT